MKKALSLVLSLVLPICSVTAVDLSAYSAAAADGSAKGIYINPLLENSRREITGRLDETEKKYRDNTAESNTISLFSLKSATSYPTAEQAAATLRDAMVKRQKHIKTDFISGTISSRRAVEEVLLKALSMEYATGSTDGDYLRWHIAGASYDGTPEIVNGRYLYHAEYTIMYLTTASEESRVTSLLGEINKALMLSGKSDYMKALEIHDFVCSTINYDYDNLYNYDYTLQFATYGGLFTGKAVCQSYATLFYRLCVENGLQCRVVTSDEHAWNIVKIYGKYYYVDCTWDDTLYDKPNSSSGKYWSNRFGWDYFLYGTKDVNDYMHALEQNYKTEEFRTNYPISEKAITCPHEALEVYYPDGASCENGFTADSLCKICKYPLGSFSPGAGTSHNLRTIFIMPGCTKNGKITRCCTSCSYSVESGYLSTPGHNYTVSPATVTKNGSKRCTNCGATASTIYHPNSFKLSTVSYIYDGKVKKPSVTVKDTKGKAITSEYYTLSYTSGRKNVGEYYVKINFKGNYSGTKKLSFYIKPKSTTISKLTSGSKKITVRVKKYTTQTTGYQIQYATNSNFTSAKSVYLGNTTTSKTIKSLKAKKKYYVRVRTYKTVNNTKYYSAWSKTKSVKTKK